MATHTTNLNLIKPEDSDNYDIDDFNDNMDTIDGAVAQLRESVSLATTTMTITNRTLSSGDQMYINVGSKNGYKCISAVATSLTVTSGDMMFVISIPIYDASQMSYFVRLYRFGSGSMTIGSITITAYWQKD